MNSSASKLHAFGLTDVKIDLYLFLYVLGSVLFMQRCLLLASVGVACMPISLYIVVASPVVCCFIIKSLLLPLGFTSNLHCKRIYLSG